MFSVAFILVPVLTPPVVLLTALTMQWFETFALRHAVLVRHEPLAASGADDGEPNAAVAVAVGPSDPDR
jgi:hypothetical protein